MAVFYFQNEAYSFPDSYREWDITIERDLAHMSLRITSRATDTTGQRHGCESLVNDHYLRYSASEAQEYFRRALIRHLRLIDDYSQNLALQQITLRPRYTVGVDLSNSPGYTGIRMTSPRPVERRGLPLSAQEAQEYFRNVLFPSEFTPERETPAQSVEPEKQENKLTSKPKRNRLEPKPPSDAPAQLSVKAKSKKLRL
jgi:hypothetical protein